MNKLRNGIWVSTGVAPIGLGLYNMIAIPGSQIGLILDSLAAVLIGYFLIGLGNRCLPRTLGGQFVEFLILFQVSTVVADDSLQKVYGYNGLFIIFMMIMGLALALLAAAIRLLMAWRSWFDGLFK